MIPNGKSVDQWVWMVNVCASVVVMYAEEAMLNVEGFCLTSSPLGPVI
jgi:hypothetical protein